MFFRKLRVWLGARLLDRTITGWHRQIDRHRLNMDVHDMCMLGQLYGSAQAGALKLGFLEFYDPFVALWLYGFASYSDPLELRGFWIQQIEKRLAADLRRTAPAESDEALVEKYKVESKPPSVAHPVYLSKDNNTLFYPVEDKPTPAVYADYRPYIGCSAKTAKMLNMPLRSGYGKAYADHLLQKCLATPIRPRYIER
ncbi:MAG: hypothetical protein JWL82_326 [Parcubacteria group bacterium]|nr:hypothetical protein [Parcubacteria group bacterium]